MLANDARDLECSTRVTDRVVWGGMRTRCNNPVRKLIDGQS